MKIGLCVAGPKGAALAAGVIEEIRPEFIVSYRQNGSSCRYDEIEKLTKSAGIELISRSDFDEHRLSTVELVFVAGWQYLIKLAPEKLVVFHDSLLPKYRGFAPTVAALIQGESFVGVTALKPEAAMDTGSILSQRSLPITYPTKISEVYSKLGDLYVEIAFELIGKMPEAVPQVHSEATYSIWRDMEDYRIDWSWTSSKIQRFVHAVGAPYGGARTSYDGNVIVVKDVEIQASPNFVERCPGKVWCIVDNCPSIVTGDGLIRITSSELVDGSRFAFEKLRVRLS